MFFKRNPSMKRVTDKTTTRNLQTKSQTMMSYKVANAQDIGRRSSQQDSFSLLGALDVHEAMENGIFAIIADGMGGMADGKAISEAAVKEFCKAYRGLTLDESIGEQLAGHSHKINESMFVQFGGDSGSTVVIAMIYRSMLYWLGIGDSAIYLMRDKSMYLINRYHNLRSDMYGELLSDDYLGANREKAEADEEADCLTQYLGLEEITSPDYNKKPLKLRPGDVVLLCSDGVSGVIGHDELCGFLSFEPLDACNKIMEAIRIANKPNQDNATAIIIACR